MSRGAIWMVWGGDQRIKDALDRSTASLKEHHPELDQRVLWMPDMSDLRCKSQMFDLSPYDQTLYLDADTVVLGDLSFGFEKAHQHGIACCINQSPWANRYTGLKGEGDIVEYDTGVVFFDKQNRLSDAVFDFWKSSGELNSESFFLSKDGPARMPINDQCGFAHAVECADFNPFVLPVNWNLHPKWQKTIFGPIRVWHDYNPVSKGVLEWNEMQGRPDAINSCGQITA
jgi:hypothetical protein